MTDERTAMTENFPTAMDALAYRTFRGGRARQLRKKAMPTLRELADSLGVIVFGRASKDELEASILEAEFPLAKENEAIHVLYHTDRQWDGCIWCARSDLEAEIWRTFPRADRRQVEHVLRAARSDLEAEIWRTFPRADRRQVEHVLRAACDGGWNDQP